MADDARRALESDVILFTSTRGKGQFYTSEQLYHELGVASRSPPVAPPEFDALLRVMADRKLLKRWRPSPVQHEVFSSP